MSERYTDPLYHPNHARLPNPNDAILREWFEIPDRIEMWEREKEWEAILRGERK